MSEQSEANVVDLTQAVNDLTQGLSSVKDSQKKVKRIARLAIAGVILDIALTLAIGGLFRKVEHNANTIRSVQCSFYGLVLGNYHPETRPVAERDNYIAQFKVIRADAKRLHCKG